MIRVLSQNKGLIFWFVLLPLISSAFLHSFPDVNMPYGKLVVFSIIHLVLSFLASTLFYSTKYYNGTIWAIDVAERMDADDDVNYLIDWQMILIYGMLAVIGLMSLALTGLALGAINAQSVVFAGSIFLLQGIPINVISLQRCKTIATRRNETIAGQFVAAMSAEKNPRPNANRNSIH